MPELSTKNYPRSPGTGSLLLLLFLVIVCVAVISAQAGFPILFITNPHPESTAVPLPQESSTSADATLTLERQSWYAIQVGSYESQEEALAEADSLRKRGGAGYVYQNGSYRLLVACYPSQEEAEEVRAKLQNNQEFSSPALYHFVSDEILLHIVATPMQSSALSQGYALLPEMIRELSRLSLALDRNTMDADAVRAAAGTNLSRANALISTMNTALSASNHPLTRGLMELLESCAQSMEQLEQNSGDTLSLSAQIKYNHMEILCRFIDYARKMGELGV
ncbi:MAG: SPOR domain-containing protein [Oscillospiraceae bacterium]|jgi:hypothetical protein|nr:SPOR domain-containing protein [Oscillospiraceae bacterium]